MGSQSQTLKRLNIHAHTAAQERPKKKATARGGGSGLPESQFSLKQGPPPTSHTHCPQQVPLHPRLIFPVAPPAQAVTQEEGRKTSFH